MVDTVTENKYINFMMQKLPEECAKTEMYTLKKGESLWELAKNTVNNGQKASKAEISEYMLRIAKLNGLDTYEKMNSLKANTKLYMPDNNAKITKSQTNIKRTSAEISALNILSTLFNDKSIVVQRPKLGFHSTMYHVYNYPNPNNKYERHVVLSYEMGEDGKIRKVSFEDENKNINTIGFDYNLDSSGRIYLNKYNFNGKQQGKITKEEFNKLEQKLNELRKTASATI